MIKNAEIVWPPEEARHLDPEKDREIIDAINARREELGCPICRGRFSDAGVLLHEPGCTSVP
jgi:hypothetical protein